jgi:hypothetical protein
MVRKIVIPGILVVAAFVVGFIFLLKGCLAAYDERSALTPALYFEKDNKAVVFTIVKFEEATSYKSGGGMTSKTVSTNYFIQINDAGTGERLQKKKIKHHQDVKNFPVTTLGDGGGRAWVFIGEPMAFDPFTLEKIADKKIIEERNPALKGKMPEQSSYYVYNNASNELLITATDGLKYSLSTTTLTATPVDDEDIAKSPLQARIKELEKKQKGLEEQYTAAYARYRENIDRLREKKISSNAYYDSGRVFNREQDTINVMQKMVRNELDDLKDLENADRDRQRDIENLTRSSKSYTSICTAADTMDGKWYGLLAGADLEKFDDRFRYRNVYTETARNKMYSAAVTVKDASKKAVELQIGEPAKLNDAVYLQGGFLLNRNTALPIHLKNGEGFIITYREKVGNDGNIILARVDLEGNAKWSVNTRLSRFLDWIYTGKRLVVLGVDNKELSSDEANLLIIIDLDNGGMLVHDYFKDKMRKAGQ